MNSKLHYILSFYHLSLAVRDTLEYVQPRENFDVNAYKAKGNTIKMSLEETSPFVIFCKNNGEIGQKVRSQLNDLYDLVYGEKATFIRLDNDHVIVDRNEIIKVLDLIIPLKVSIYNIMKAFFKDLEEEYKEKDSLDLVELEYEYYANVIQLVLSQYLFTDRFDQFNKEMREHNGQESFESNFTISEMNKVIGMYKYIYDNIGKNYQSFLKNDEIFKQGLELMSGKVKMEKDLLPTVKALPSKMLSNLSPLETSFKNAHFKVWGQLREFEIERKNESSKTLN